MQYPRIEVISHKEYNGINAMNELFRSGKPYAERFEVRTLRPNKPMRSRTNLCKFEAEVLAKRELARLKAENYNTIVFKGQLIRQ